MLLETDLVPEVIDNPEGNPAVVVTPQDVVAVTIQRHPAGERSMLFKVDLVATAINSPQRNLAIGLNSV